MRRLVFQIGLVFLALLTTGVDCNGDEQPTPPPEKFEPFSFAIITDLHIGYGVPNYFPDYPTESKKDWLDGLEGSPGNNDNQIETLQGIVERIIKEKDNFNIKSVVALGDISDTAEKSEFLRAREILNRLNEAGIPYIPLIGNHDTWPYTQVEENFDPDNRKAHATIADHARGDEFFEEIFWGEANNSNIQLIKDLFGDSWQRSQNPISDLQNVNHLVYLQNSGFSYKGITFVTLDLAPRAKEDRNPKNGVAYPGATLPGGIPNPQGAFATSHEQTVEFSRNYTKNHTSERKTAILFSHHPLGLTGLFKYVRRVPEDYTSVYNFAGHLHTTEDSYQFFSWTNSISFQILTEDIGEINLETTMNRTGKPIRIIQVREKDIDYSVLLPKKVPIFLTPSPQVTPSPITACPPEGEPKFSLGQEVVTTDDLRVRSEPTLSAQIIKTEPKGTSGKILEGPVCANDYIWWKVEYEDGTIGWSAENWLGAKILIEPPTPITPIPETLTPLPAQTPSSIFELKGKIAFVGEGAAPTIYTVNTDGTELIKLRPGLSPSWSPNGSKIVFVGWTNQGIGIINEDGSGLQWLLEDDFYYSRVSWSSDGNQLAFTKTEGRVWEDEPINLWVMNVDGSNQTKLPIDSGVYSFSWSPDSKKIVFSTSGTATSRWISSGGRCEANSSIYLVDLENHNQEKLADGCHPAWSPEENKIAFVKEERNTLYVMNIDTGEIILAKSLPFKVYDIVWSPDGNWLALGVDYTGYSHRIYFWGPEDQLIQLQTGTWAMHPSWSVQE